MIRLIMSAMLSSLIVLQLSANSNSSFHSLTTNLTEALAAGTQSEQDSTRKEHEITHRPLRPGDKDFGNQLKAEIKAAPELRDAILAKYDLLEPKYTVSDYTVEAPEGDMTMANTADSLALLDLYNSTIGDSWYNNANWKTGPLDTWYGITVEGDRVTEINLSNNNLFGSLPESLFGLTELRVLDLSYNSFGFVPLSTNIGNLTKLEVLYIQSAALEGAFPASIMNCINLQYLNMEGYYTYYDVLPAGFLDLPLIELNLNNTYLEGAFPSSTITTLEILGLSGCYFNGEFPTNLSGNTNLRELYLRYNSWLSYTSVVPTEISNFTNLEVLDISDNYLYEIPSFVFTPSLKKLMSYYNQLTDTEADFFANAFGSNLEFIDISYSYMYGAIPNSINSATSLDTLYASGNNFDELPDLTTSNPFAYYDFSGNNLTFEDLENQTLSSSQLYVQYMNQVFGEQYIYLFEGQNIVLDATTGGSSNSYQWWDYDGGMLEGETSSTLLVGGAGTYYCSITNDAVTSTYGITLNSGNYYVSTIPSGDADDSLALVTFFNEAGMADTYYADSWLQEPLTFWQGVSMDQDGFVTDLSLSNLGINGPLPVSVSNLDSLRSLQIDYSGITSVPAEIGNLAKLTELNFAGNVLTALPTEFSNLSNLEDLNLGSNSFISFPTSLIGLSSLYTLELQYNELTSFPENVGEMTGLHNLYLYGNKIDMLPNMDAFSGISNIDLDDNYLDFGDLEELDPFITNNLSYYDQNLKSSGDFQVVTPGTEYTTSISVEGFANTYQWYANDELIEGETEPSITYTVNETTALICAISNPGFPSLTLYTDYYQLYIPSSFSIPGPGLLYGAEVETYDSTQMYYDESNEMIHSDFLGNNFQILGGVVEMEQCDIDEQNGRIYFAKDLFADQSALMYIDLLTGNIVNVYQGAFDELEAVAVDPVNQYIYFTDGCCGGGVAYIKRVNYDGTNETTLVSGLNSPFELDLDLVNGKIYWVDDSNNGRVIQRSNLNGSVVETILSVPDFDGNFTVDAQNSFLFWTGGSDSDPQPNYVVEDIGRDPKIIRANLDGSDVSPYSSLVNFTSAYTIDQSTQTIYYISHSYSEEMEISSVRKTNLDGSIDELVTDFPPNTYGYWIRTYRGEGGAPPEINAEDLQALRAIYNALGGPSWINNSGWNTAQPVSEWYGVSLQLINNEYRVTSISLPSNNLTGKLNQNFFTNLTELRSVNLSGNNLTGGIPAAFFTLTKLQVVKLGNNKLSATFPNPGEGYVAPWVTFEINDNGFYGKLPSTGNYPSLQRLKLDSNKFEGRVVLPLANMTSLKQLTINNNLLSGELPDVSTLTSIDSLNASTNAFTGTIPASFNGLETMSYLNLSNNQLTGNAGSITAYAFIDLSNNKFTDVSGINDAAQIDVSNNWLDFSDFNSISEFSDITYYPQKNLFDRVDSLHTANQELVISFPIDDTEGNSYQWRRAALSTTGQFTFNDLTDSTSSVLNFDNPDGVNEGAYRLVITNSGFPEMPIQTSAFLLKITSLERDKAALLALLDSTEGFTPNNWSAENDITAGNWEGVTLNQANTRVTSLILPGTADRHWEKGIVPESFGDLTGMLTFDLSGHELSSFPDITTMRSLTEANISGNRLSFAHLIPNKPLINKITYAPQRRYGETDYDTLDAGANYLLEVDDMGEGSQYRWLFGPYTPGQLFNNDTITFKGDTRLLAIDNLDYDQQGTYRVYVRHPDYPALTIQSRNKNIMAKTDLEGTVNKNFSPLTTGAEIFIWRKTPAGPFVKEDSAGVSTTDGSYSFKDVVLGDFVVQVKPNRQADSTTIQTYYIASESYKDADLLALRTDTTDIDIDLLFYSQATKDAAGATISGTLISDFDETEVDEEGNRVQSRRKVRKAACSMRRFKSQGRPGQDGETEIAYYIETDDEGYFNFDGVEPGTYLINIEFPGVPMDPSSEVEFVISEDKENQVFEVDALITELGIVIEQTEVLFNWKPYVKEVNLYPNPTYGLLGIDYLVYRNIEDLKIEVLNIQGVKILESKINHIKGRHNTSLDMTNFEAGMYFVIFTDDEGTFKHEYKVTKK